MEKTDTHSSLPSPVFATPANILIIRSPYYKDISDQQLIGAKAACAASKVNVEIAEVPGALEIPTAIALAMKSGRYDGYVALGCVIRGETTHYDTVCNDSSRGLTLLGLQGACIGNGILTVENRDQALARADAQGQNKGGGAAEAALHLVALARKFGHRPSKIAPTHEHIKIAGDAEHPQEKLS